MNHLEHWHEEKTRTEQQQSLPQRGGSEAESSKERTKSNERESCVPDLSSSCHPGPAAREDLIKQHSFSSTSVNSNTVTQISVRQSGERGRVSGVPRSKDCAFWSE
ncbi:uncharacterized protein V6R79_001812 [Siganus canaliculatus]